jgi:hypothetical protein
MGRDGNFSAKIPSHVICLFSLVPGIIDARNVV